MNTLGKYINKDTLIHRLDPRGKFVMLIILMVVVFLINPSISQYQIVGDYEADIERNKISLSSPLAKALIGKEIGDVAEYLAPNGKKSYEIIEVKWL